MSLTVQNITKRFGGLTAVDDVSFSVTEQTILGLIGPNGAGKSTLFNCMSGFDTFDEGRIEIDGRELRSGFASDFIDAGISRTFQNTSLFDSMTVRDNITVALSAKVGANFWGAFLGRSIKGMHRSHYHKSADMLLVKYGLFELADSMCSALSAGQRRNVEVVRAVAMSPRFVLLDEPAAGLNATETERLKEVLLRIKDGGTGVVVVEHDLRLIMGISDEIVVLNQGRKIAQGSPYIIQMDSEVQRAYLGV